MLTTDTEFLRAEIMDVLRLFREEESDFIHTFSREGENYINVIERGGISRAFSDSWHAENELQYRRFAKRSAKLAFYLFLSESTGKTFPWGALTGIRPTKMAYAELAEGRDFAPLFKKFRVSDENIKITGRVLAAQREVYLKNRGRGADIFVGIPFCPTKCSYCSFITAPMPAVGKYAEEYTDCLVKEIESLSSLNLEINSVYVGGGTPFCMSESQLARIYAAISGNFGTAEVELFYDKDSDHCCAGKFTINGRLSSFKELQVAIGASPEEEECAVYINADDFRKFVPFAEYDFARKLNLYLNYTPQKGNSDIMGIPQLKEVLRGFISSFEQIPINSSKDMWLSITKDGVFVPLWRGEERHDLSVAEREIFNFHCYVEVNKFWGQVTAECHSSERLPPLFIGDFAQVIDRATDITPFISRANSLGRQTFLFCRNEHTLRRFGV